MTDTVPLTINLSRASLIAMAREQLGMVFPGEEQAGPNTPLQVAFHRRYEGVTKAIEQVIRAMERYDQAQYSNGEASAAAALFEASKRLRNAVFAEKQARTEKGKLHV